MKYQETGRFGRITKNLRNNGHQDKMDEILHDSVNFPGLNKKDQAVYIETVMDRMVHAIGQADTDRVLFSCGEQCCGKSWSTFAKRIWNDSDNSVEKFIANMNIEEEKYSTEVSFDSKNRRITVNRSRCICGLINRGNPFQDNRSFCNCSIGHMQAFFSSVFKVENVKFSSSIMNGDSKCEWEIQLGDV